MPTAYKEVRWRKRWEEEHHAFRAYRAAVVDAFAMSDDPSDIRRIINSLYHYYRELPSNSPTLIKG